MVEIEIPEADPDLAEYYEVSWTAGSNGRLYTESMEGGEGEDCVDIAGQHLAVTDEIPGEGTAGANSAYLINTSSGGVTAYLLLQDSPNPAPEPVTVAGPKPLPGHELKIKSYHPEGVITIPERGVPEAQVTVEGSEPVVSYEWILDRAPPR